MKFKSSQLTQSKTVDFSCPSWILSKRPHLRLLYTTTIISQLAAPSSGQPYIAQLLCPTPTHLLSAEHSAKLRGDCRWHTSNTYGETTAVCGWLPTLQLPWPVCGHVQKYCSEWYKTITINFIPPLHRAANRMILVPYAVFLNTPSTQQGPNDRSPKSRYKF